MQFFLNIVYHLLDKFFGLVGHVATPDWFSDISLSIAKYCVIANWYFPIDTLVTVALSVLAVTVILMIISALLQIF